MAEKEKIFAGKRWVQSHFSDKKHESEEETDLTVANDALEVRAFPEDVEPAKVHCSLGSTINLGNFESARVDVGYSIPCFSEEMPAAMEACLRMTSDTLKQETKAIREFAKNRRKK